MAGVVSTVIDDDDDNDGGGDRSMAQSTSTLSIDKINERYNRELLVLQANESTYVTDPLTTTVANSNDDWPIDLDKLNIDFEKLLHENVTMSSLHTKLGPAQVSNVQFGLRYFYKVNQLEEERKKRLKLLERASSEAQPTQENKNDWDDEEETQKVVSATNSNESTSPGVSSDLTTSMVSSTTTIINKESVIEQMAESTTIVVDASELEKSASASKVEKMGEDNSD